MKNQAVAFCVVCLVALLTIAMFSGCSLDLSPGTQLSGQECLQDGDCLNSFSCIDRRCTPRNVRRASGGDTAYEQPNDDISIGPDAPPQDASPIGIDIDVEPPPNCQPGQRFCVDDATAGRCRVVPGGGVVVEATRCRSNQSCENGVCTNDPVVNDGCCDGGCGSNQFCSNCKCQAYDEQICRFQDQPCVQEGSFINNYYCTKLTGSGELRCYGTCDRTLSNPDASCPGQNSVCTLGEEERGLCLSSCDPDKASCGEPGMACLPTQTLIGGGFCVPTNENNQLGDRCDLNSLLDCTERALCLELEPNTGGRCVEVCRPFAKRGGNTDCSKGHCLAFSPTLGICVEDNDFKEGETCQPLFTTCSEDALACYPSPGIGTRCSRVCRLSQGSADCTDGRRCLQYDPEQVELGVCL
ncbi:MAG: hypothetical protein H0U74_07400 [Bradymonadaceae bacterium]|nr:hypothetical protein [Lujinxingiaceae bacterium]